MTRVLLVDFKEESKKGTEHCCERMTQEVEFVCPTCEDALQCPDKLVYYSSVFDEYGLLIHDGSGTYQLIDHCPWCGKELPRSRRDECFEELEERGFEDPLNEDIPKEFQSNKWYK